MRNLLVIACFLTYSFLNANMSLSKLIEYDKTSCLERLNEADDAELWDVFLGIQADLFFDHEALWLGQETWWSQAERMLEIGSGNGVYLSRLAVQFQEKTFQGIEKQPLFVTKSNERFMSPRLGFQEGDAVVFYPQWVNSADVVLFRLTLQHLSDPIIALQNAWHYLAPGGHILIIDSCDMAKQSSHPIIAIQEALKLVAEHQREKGRGNRRITLDLLKALESEKDPLSDLYEVAFSNLSQKGEILCEIIRFEGERDRKISFNQGLLFLNLLHRTYQIPVDFDTAYDQLKAYLKDDTAWSTPGMHYLVLKKKS
jgi:SAM-dependent methyltransferase